MDKLNRTILFFAVIFAVFGVFSSGIIVGQVISSPSRISDINQSTFETPRANRLVSLCGGNGECYINPNNFPDGVHGDFQSIIFLDNGEIRPAMLIQEVVNISTVRNPER